MEQWKSIPGFNYSVSDYGQIRSDKTGRIMALNQNQYGVLTVGMMREGEQYHRSVPLLVARAFLGKHQLDAFDTPINLDGDRLNNHIENLVWRPRWFAVKYNRQFREPYEYPIHGAIQDTETGAISENSFECAKRYGLLEEEVVLSILNHTYAWPTYQRFALVDD